MSMIVHRHKTLTASFRAAFGYATEHQLSDVARFSGGRLVQEASFESLGAFRSLGWKKLCPVYSEKYLPHFEENRDFIAAIIVTPEIYEKIEFSGGVLIHPNPNEAFFGYHMHLAEKKRYYQENIPSQISPRAKIHPRAYVAETNVVIGDGVEIGPMSCVLENTIVMQNTIIGMGVSIGGPGFEFRQMANGLVAIPHVGGVVIGENVEIQANCAISRAIFDAPTIVGEQTKLDNLVHIAHGAVMGARTRLAACAEISGSTISGEDVWYGPNCTVSNSLRIGDKASVTIGAVCITDVNDGQRVIGAFGRLR
jgi:UDP-3-O-[3-hydroxymyristoyl] glucosamine N-acyltransferase